MRILIATDNYYPNVNGASYATQRLAQNLQRKGHTVAVVAPARGLWDEEFEQDGISIYGIRAFKIERLYMAWPFFIEKPIRNVFKDFQPDIVHIESHFPLSATAARVAKRLGVPVVGTNHFMPENLVHYLRLPPPLERGLVRIMWNHFLRTFNRIDAVAAPTDTAAGLLKAIGFPGPIVTISNGIDLVRFNPFHEGEHLRRRHALPEGPLMLSVGRLDKEKHLDAILRAFARVAASVPAHFAIAGTGAEQKNLKRLTNELGLEERVSFIGFVPDEDLPALYATADCFVIAGTFELQSLVTMEAMATGLPVVAVEAMALPELVHHEENGFLFPHGDLEALAARLRTLLTDAALRERMGRESLRIIAGHTMDAVIDETVKTYERVRRTR